MNITALPITGLTGGALGLLYLILSSWVSLRRIQIGRSLGDGKDHQLKRAIRVHGNFAEFVPLLLVLLGLVELTDASRAFVGGLAVTLVLARLAHAVGLGLTHRVSQLRRFGAAFTYLLLAVASGRLIVACWGLVF